MRICLFYTCNYFIILRTQLVQAMVCKKAIEEDMSISMNEVWLVLNLFKIERFYKTDNFNSDIAFGVSLFVLCDFNTYFQL